RRGELLLEAGRVLAFLAPSPPAARLEAAQPRGEPVARRAGVARDRVEPVVAEGDLAHGEQRPLLADQVQCGRHRAGAAGQFLAHASQTTLVAKSTPLGLRSGRRSIGWVFKPIKSRGVARDR